MNNFAKFSWAVLAYTIFVILWGAMVRATGSGAGCGSHWPLCNGEVVPLAPQIETIIEYGHRLTSGLALIFVIVMFVWAWRSYPKGHHVRLGALLSFVFIIIESLIGAALVLFELVAYNDSTARAIVIALHLVNTFILLAVMTLTAWWASGGQPMRWRGQGWLGWAVALSFASLLAVGATGAVVALGDTLFPPETLREGLEQKFDPEAHFAVRLRAWHPLIAIIAGVFTIAVMNIYKQTNPTTTIKWMTQSFTGLYIFQLIVGAFNVVLLAPLWMQVFHLLVSDVLLIIFTIFVAEAFADKSIAEERHQPQVLTVSPAAK